jgi:hypothetical protein
MEPESSLPYSQVPATRPYPEPTPSTSHDPLQLPVDPFNIILPSTTGSPQWPLSLSFSHHRRATCPVHLIFLDLTTRTILGTIVLE